MSRQVFPEDLFFSERLKMIDTIPKMLYCIGDVSIFRTRCIAICGSRKCTPYGVSVARKIASEAASCGITVVSGLAMGIDTAAHQGALQAGGKTIAVLGNGVDICYPRQNLQLYREICQKGLVVSEYPDGTKAMPFHFPMRNRIIAGLSEAVVVVEAANRSGALITAEKMMDYGRDVYAVPGQIFSASSFGSNHLILDGAMPLVDIGDLFRDLGVQPQSVEEQRKRLGPDEEKVYALVAQHGEISIDNLCKETLYNPKTMNGIITVLEMKGLLVCSMGKVFLAEFVKK